VTTEELDGMAIIGRKGRYGVLSREALNRGRWSLSELLRKTLPTRRHFVDQV